MVIAMNIGCSQSPAGGIIEKGVEICVGKANPHTSKCTRVGVKLSPSRDTPVPVGLKYWAPARQFPRAGMIGEDYVNKGWTDLEFNLTISDRTYTWLYITVS